MNKIIVFLLMAFIYLNASAQESNRPYKDFVLDSAKNFTTAQADSLQELLLNHYYKTGDELYVVTTDNVGGDIDTYVWNFLTNHSVGNVTEEFGMVFLLSVKNKQFSETPNNKLEVILTQTVLNNLGQPGAIDLKAHRYFIGIWKQLMTVIDFLNVPENRKKSTDF